MPFVSTKRRTGHKRYQEIVIPDNITKTKTRNLKIRRNSICSYSLQLSLLRQAPFYGQVQPIFEKYPFDPRCPTCGDIVRKALVNLTGLFNSENDLQEPEERSAPRSRI